MTVVTSNIQLGTSGTPANNFTITAEAANGTMKLARGNAGATTQDILTVDSSGNITPSGNILAGAFGAGQTRQNVTGSRVAGTTYTNTTGKPIQVIIEATSTTAGYTVTFTVGGISYGWVLTSGGAAYKTTVSHVVLPGESYSVAVVNCTMVWTELR